VVKCVFHWMLEVTSGVTVGAPPLGSNTDTATFRFIEEDSRSSEPIIPSSSIRGVWRSATCYASTARGGSCCGTKNPEEAMKIHKLLEERNQVVYRIGNMKLCTVCAIFGLPHVDSIVEFSHAEPIKINNLLLNSTVSVSMRPGIALDDYSGRVQEGKLYYREVLDPGSLLYFKMVVSKPVGNEEDERIERWCELLCTLVSAAKYVEAIGVGRGMAAPRLLAIEEVEEDKTITVV